MSSSLITSEPRKRLIIKISYPKKHAISQLIGLHIALKLFQKIRKNSRIMTSLEATSYETPPHKIQNFIV